MANDNRAKIGQIEPCFCWETIATRDVAGDPDAMWVQTA